MSRDANPLQHVERFIVVMNPRSTNADRAAHYVTALQQALPNLPTTVVETVPDETLFQQRLAAALDTARPRSQLLIAAGGDGTVHLIMNTLMRAEMPDALRRTPLTAWALGNGNDFFHTIHTKAAERNALGILRTGQPQLVQIHPLEITIRTKNGEKQIKHALCYATLGATGKATQAINNPDHRERRKALHARVRLMHDLAQGAPAILLPDPFTITMKGQQQLCTEMQFLNGPIMTIHARYNVRLSEPAMFVSIIHPNTPITSVVATTRMFLGKPLGRLTRKAVRFKLEHGTPAQVDGEYFLMPAGNITIKRSANALTVWATQPI